ncbi:MULTISPECIES: NF038122 family metalloprotease [unclassified Bradyrhizobium]|uniref:NF038122 family metalloprotease n=1 Tax=unclassified Bradyrhizobium TaxID=2631580 RepID=UPI001FF953BC|nr:MULTISPECIES: NF038122 family metalloprotease [unclassified Bradyrhizobium]MCK1711156.1 NF038122 family metalloprotease [Bradyrhizobium sp. 143]MCK1726836.1 NF038122 family metalloprotease [Bradyrhizobium sp. 142]
MATTPIVIYNISDLQAIQNDLSGYYVLGADIDATGFTFTPIGSVANPFTGIFASNPFTGTFDGQGYTISNLTIDREHWRTDAGLFGMIGATGTVRNVGLINELASSPVFSDAGGLVGENFGTVSESYVTGNIGGFGFVGALVGINYGTVSQSYATGSASGGSVGVLVGYNSPTGSITQSFSTGTASSGQLSSSGRGTIGGLVGHNDGVISDSYSSAATDPSFDTSNFANEIGGLVGYNNGTVTQSYATGATGLVRGGSSVLGGLIGAESGLDSVIASYWDTETSGQSASAAGIGLTTAQLQSGTLPAGFDPTIWFDIAGQFPELRWQAPAIDVNHAPVASTIAADANEDTNILPVKLTALFTDADLSDTFTFSKDTTGTAGLVINNLDGTFTYDPTGKFESLGVGETTTDTFTYTVTDNHGASSTATATVTVHGENDAPIAVPDVVSMQKGTTFSAGKAHGVLANDIDPDTHDNPTLKVSAVNGSSNLIGYPIKGTYGTLTLAADGSYTYATKNNAPVGAQDVFHYTISDDHGATSVSTLTLQVPYPALVIGATLAGSVSERPLVTGGSAIDQASPGSITLNVPDPVNPPTATIDKPRQTITWQDSTHDYTPQLTSAELATLAAAFLITQTGNANTEKVTWAYKIHDSALDFLGANETIRVTTPIVIDDHHGNLVTEKVVVTINGADDKPIASTDTATASQSGTVHADVTDGVLANDTDPDLHDLGHLVISAVQGDAGAVGHSIIGKYGTLTLAADGSYGYVQTARVPDGAGPDVFKYTVSDGHGGTDVSTLSIDVPSGERVTYHGSGLVFYNKYDATVTPAYHNAIIAAENFFQSHFTDAVTINLHFATEPGNSDGTDFVAKNVPTGYPVSNTGYEQLKEHLGAAATTTDDLTAIASLPESDPSSNLGFFVTPAEQKVLGLPDPNDNAFDGTVYLDSKLSYFYNGDPTGKDAFKFDAVGALEHEISEEMGRLGGLGPDVGSFWSTMDLFRYSTIFPLIGVGHHDYDPGHAAFFSINGQISALSSQFNDNPKSGDMADWKGVVQLFGGIDAFGAGTQGQKEIVTATDLQIMDVLGWTPTSPPSITMATNLSGSIDYHLLA